MICLRQNIIITRKRLAATRNLAQRKRRRFAEGDGKKRGIIKSYVSISAAKKNTLVPTTT